MNRNGKIFADGNIINIFEESVNFKSYNIQEKPSTYVVHHGGWVIYEKANCKGKFMYHHDGSVFSITNIGHLKYFSR